MSALIITHNDYGTPVANFKCQTCGSKFTVCGGVPEGRSPEEQAQWALGWENCLGPDCPSYDPNRDAEVLLMTQNKVRTHHIVGIDMLRARRTGILKENKS